MTSRAAPMKVISKQLTFGYRIALKQDRQAVSILGHQCWLPASSASLIQKIGKRILVFPRMPRQLHHHSLVFFHQGLEIMSP